MTSKIQPNTLSPADCKRNEWNEKKSLQLRENALKIASIALCAILGAAVTLASIYLIPIVPIASSLLLTLGVAGAGGYIATALAAAFTVTFSDKTNYRNRYEVQQLFQEIKNAEVPLPVSRFKRMHRFGIISDDELEQRSDLEKDCKQYRQCLRDLQTTERELVLKQRQLKKLEPLTSMEDQKASLNKEIEELNEEKDRLVQQRDSLIDKFKKFNQSIVDFNPYT